MLSYVTDYGGDMMTDIMKDVLETKRINSSEKYHINYDSYERIYFKSNEDCHHIISKLDIFNVFILEFNSISLICPLA